jgi:recombination protein RecA
MRLDIRKVETLKRGQEVIGARTRVKVTKNKLAPPFRVAEFDIIYPYGISTEGVILDLGVSLGVLQKSGSFISYGDIRLGQGREQARSFLRENPDIFREIEEEVRKRAVHTNSTIPMVDVDYESSRESIEVPD